MRVSFSEKKFNEWINERVNFFDKMYGLPADLERAARWGYEEANRNADDAEANGKIIGYDLAVAELKARDAQRHKILLKMRNNCVDCEGWFSGGNEKLFRKLLLVEEAKTR